VAARRLLCACRPCYLLFTTEGAAGGRYRAVPERYRVCEDAALTPAQWERLQVPVGIAFFFVNSALGRTVAFYPSPAGATESLLPLEAWDEIRKAALGPDELAPDVEALLVDRRRDGFTCYVVPIDACYALVGRVKMWWKGFDGGEEAWREIDAFFDDVRARSEGRAAPARP